MISEELEILLVEDNSADAELTIRALKKHNLANRMLHLENGADALDYLYAKGEYANRNMMNLPKVILLDINMPKISGIDVLRTIKTDERTKMIPVIMLSSSKEDPDIKQCYGLGANSYVLKPVAFNDFMKAVKDLGLYWLLLNQPPQR